MTNWCLNEIRKIKNGQNFSSDKIFRLTKVTKFSDGDENFVQRKILSDIVLSDKEFWKIGIQCEQESISIKRQE